MSRLFNIEAYSGTISQSGGPYYTPQHLNDMLGSADSLCVSISVDSMTGTPGGTQKINFYIQQSNDGIAWGSAGGTYIAIVNNSDLQNTVSFLVGTSTC